MGDGTWLTIPAGQDLLVRDLEIDPAARHAIYRRVEEIIARDALLLPLFHEQVYRFARPEVEGLRLSYSVPSVAYEELSVRQ